MSRLFIILYTLFIVDNNFGNVVDYFEAPVEGDVISRYYRLGPYLIYDCKNRNFVCADLQSFESCKLRRQNAYIRQKRYLDCAPLKEFKTLQECKQENYRLIHSINNLSFCINI